MKNDAKMSTCGAAKSGESRITIITYGLNEADVIHPQWRNSFGGELKLFPNAFNDIDDFENRRNFVSEPGEDELRLRNLMSDFLNEGIETIRLPDSDLDGVDFHGALLAGADLRRAILRMADLSHANLSRAKLSYSDLTFADLEKSDLSDADLSHSDLCKASLKKSCLRNADLEDADLEMANLSEADLRGARLRGADLRRANLRGAFFDALTEFPFSIADAKKQGLVFAESHINLKHLDPWSTPSLGGGHGREL